MRPFRSTAAVLLAIAAIDGILDAIEHYTTVNLWQPLVVLAIVLFLVDLAFETRTIWIDKLFRRKDKPEPTETP